MSLLRNCGLAVMLALSLAASASAQIAGGRWGVPGAAYNLLNAVKEDRAPKDTVIPEFTVTVENGGTLADGNKQTTGKFKVGVRVDIIAYDSLEHHKRFKEWHGNATFDDRTSGATHFTMPGNDVTISAAFAQLHKVTVDDGSIVNPPPGDMFAEGDRVNIAAAGLENHKFDRWTTEEGDVTINRDRDSATYFTMRNEPVKVQAHYVPAYQLTVEGGYLHGTTANTGRFAENDPVRIVDNDSAGHRFVRWEPDGENSNIAFQTLAGRGAQFFMPGRDITVTAVFEEVSLYKVMMTAGDTITNPKSADGQFESEFAAGDTVRIKARTEDNKVFEGWEFDPDDITAFHNNTAFIMPQYDVSVRAILREKVEDELRINRSIHTVNHRDESAEGGGDIEGPRTAWADDIVTLTANPLEYRKLVKWDISGYDGTPEINGNTVTFTMPNNEVTATATFQPTHYRVSFETDNNGQISVDDGEAQYEGSVMIPANSEAVFTAIPDDGYKVVKWEHGNVGVLSEENTLTLTIIGDTTVWVTFSEIPTSSDTYDYDNGIFTISTAGDLLKFANDVNGGRNFGGKPVTLANDIDLGGQSWSPIGTANRPFRGTFDGGDNTVSGFWINMRDVHNVGFFGYVDDGKVQDLHIVADSIIGHINVGGVVGNLRAGEVINCGFSGKVSGSKAVGGVVGLAEWENSSITKCYSTGEVIGAGINTATAPEAMYSGIGGVVGIISSGRLSKSYSTSNVTARDSVGSVGGVVGQLFNGSVTYSYSTGDVRSDNNVVGGVVGYLEAHGGAPICTVSYSYSTGTIDGRYRVGGIVGRAEGSSTINNCAVLNDSITGMGGGYVLGVANGSGANASSYNVRTDKTIKTGSGGGGDADIQITGIYGINDAPTFSNNSMWDKSKSNTLPALRDVGGVQPIAMPCHLTTAGCSPSSPPSALSPTASVVAPSPAPSSTGKVSVGPNPVSMSTGSVGIYVGADGTVFTEAQANPPVANPPASAKFIIYDAVGNIVHRINYRNDNANANITVRADPRVRPSPITPARPLAVWDLRDRRGRPVSPGTYLLRGIVVTVDGRREKVSVVFGVR